ncbi:MAG: diaminopimelate decarboxylase [Paracoccaceae bacterium]
MDHFNYRDGQLYAEDVSVAEIAASVGTPFYVYSTATLVRHFQLFDDALDGMDHCICYAMKAASNQAILKTLGTLGAGMDVVSGGEYRRAISAGIPPEKVVFSGVGKTLEEITLALQNGIRQFNVESDSELEQISATASSMNKIAPIAIRINPDVDAQTHEKIATGKAENKFGIPISRARDVYSKASKMPGISIVGIDLHIGSQLTDLEPFQKAYQKLADLTQILRQDGHKIKRLDLGGGLGIPYEKNKSAPPLPVEYGKMVRKVLGHLDCEIEIEPGRLIVGNAGILVSSVLGLKNGDNRNFLILDAAMNDLIRPAMYDAYHDIIPVKQLSSPEAVYDVVGPVCETGDTFAKKRTMPELSKNDLVAFRSAGAYGAVMSSEYNTRPLIPEVMVNKNEFSIIRKRPSYEEIIERDIIPDWLE